MTSTAADIVDFATATADESHHRPDPDRILSGDPAQRVLNYFTDASGQLSAGVWEGAVGKWRVRYTEDEFCHLLAGTVELADEAGGTRRFTAGDSFVIPAGFAGTWETLAPARKLYVVFERNSGAADRK
jgi:uncharacterized protein